MNNGEICFSVCYIQGFVTKQTFVKLSCPTIQTPSNKTIEYQGCILNLPPCSYTLSATDIDAVDSIDTMPATSFEGIIIIVSATGHGCPYSNASTLLKTITVMPTTTVILRGTDRSCFFVLWLINASLFSGLTNNYFPTWFHLHRYFTSCCCLVSDIWYCTNDHHYTEHNHLPTLCEVPT